MKKAVVAMAAVMAISVFGHEQKITVTVENKLPPPPQELNSPEHSNRTVVLVLRDESKSGLPIKKQAFEEGFTSALRNDIFRVINPNDSLKDGVINVESPIDLARLKKAHGAVVVSIDGLYVRPVSSDSSNNMLKYEVFMGFRLVDAWSEGTVCSSDPDLPVRASSTQYDTNNGRDPEQQYHLDELLRTAGVKCARELLQSPELKTWVPTPPPPPKPLPPPPDERSEFDKMVDMLTNKMLMDELFWKNYGNLKENLSRKPRVLIGSMKNKSGRPDFDAGLEVAGKRFQEKLYGSAKFDVLPDDQTATDIAERLVKAVGTETDDLIDELKQHGSPDLYVVWELIYSVDLDGTRSYNFILTISHLRRPGGVFWTGGHKFPIKVKEGVLK